MISISIKVFVITLVLVVALSLVLAYICFVKVSKRSSFVNSPIEEQVADFIKNNPETYLRSIFDRAVKEVGQAYGEEIRIVAELNALRKQGDLDLEELKKTSSDIVEAAVISMAKNAVLVRTATLEKIETVIADMQKSADNDCAAGFKASYEAKLSSIKNLKTQSQFAAQHLNKAREQLFKLLD